jgi:hypothetical protein
LVNRVFVSHASRQLLAIIACSLLTGIRFFSLDDRTTSTPREKKFSSSRLPHGEGCVGAFLVELPEFCLYSHRYHLPLQSGVNMSVFSSNDDEKKTSCRRRQIEHSSSSYLSLFMIVFDFNIDDVDRLIELPTSRQ